MRFAVLTSIFLALTATAAVVPRYSLENLVDRSPIVVEGRITRSWTAWDPKHKYIWTHHEVQVSDAIRGGSSSVTVSEPGGSLDGVNMGASGTLPYDQGEHVVLFLFRTPIGYWRTTGGGQGKFSVTQNGRVWLNTAGLEFAESAGAGRATSLSSVDRMDLSHFKSLVRSMVRTRPAPVEVQ